MQISSVSELSKIDSTSLAVIHLLSDDQLTKDYITANISNLNLAAKNILIEGSNPSNDDYDSVKIPYLDFLSSVILHDVKSFLNLTNHLVSSDLSTDYRFNDIFNAQLAVDKLSIVTHLYAENAEIKRKLNALEATISNITATLARFTSAIANNLSTTNLFECNTSKAYVNNKPIVNEIIGLDSSEETGDNTGVKIYATRGYGDDKNKYTLGVNVDWAKARSAATSINVPVGAIIPMMGSFPIQGTATDDAGMVKKGFLLCNGKVVNSITYSELYSVIGDRFNLPTDDFGGERFRLPQLDDGRYLIGLSSWASDEDKDYKRNPTFGGSLPEALPNISGEFIVADSVMRDRLAQYSSTGDDYESYGGALRRAKCAYVNKNSLGEDSLEGTNDGIIFDASMGLVADGKYGKIILPPVDSRVVYGKGDNNNQVRPKSTQVRFYIKALSADSDFTDEKNDKLMSLSNFILNPATYTNLGGILLYNSTELTGDLSSRIPVLLDSSTNKAYVNVITETPELKLAPCKSLKKWTIANLGNYILRKVRITESELAVFFPTINYPYIATEDCVIYYNIVWDCNGHDSICIKVLHPSATDNITVAGVPNWETSASKQDLFLGHVYLKTGDKVWFDKYDHTDYIFSVFRCKVEVFSLF